MLSRGRRTMDFDVYIISKVAMCSCAKLYVQDMFPSLVADLPLLCPADRTASGQQHSGDQVSQPPLLKLGSSQVAASKVQTAMPDVSLRRCSFVLRRTEARGVLTRSCWQYLQDDRDCKRLQAPPRNDCTSDRIPSSLSRRRGKTVWGVIL